MFVKDQKTLMLSVHTKQNTPVIACHVCHTQTFCHPLLPAVLLCENYYCPELDC